MILSRLKLSAFATAILAVLIAAFLCGCAEPRQGFVDDGRLKVVCTTSIVGDTVRAVGGDRIQIVTLMGAGIDPHVYKARESDVLALAEADIVFYSGLHLEAKLADVFERMGGGVRTVAIAAAIPEQQLMASPDYPDMHDPHVWFDVPLWALAAGRTIETLAAEDPANAAAYDAGGAAFLDELEVLDQFVKQQAGSVPEGQRLLVTAHDAFGYFGRAYGFEVVGLQGISTEAEAGTADVRELAELISSRRIRAIFVESSVPVRNIRAVQEATRARGWEVIIGGELFSDALGTTGTPEGTYIGMVRHNISSIAAALQGTAEPGHGSLETDQ